MHGDSGANERERGFALLVVLWALALLALLATRLTATGRSELQIASSLQGQAQLQAAADGLIYVGIFRLANGFSADGRDHPAPVAGGQGTVRITNLDGRINPNTASQALITSLLRRVGVPQRMAASLGAAILDWRTPGPRRRPGGAKCPFENGYGLG